MLSSLKGVISLVLLAALLPPSSLTATERLTGIRVLDNDKAIYGGSAVVPEKFPFMAGIYERGNVSCGAAIIAPTWLVTAAHCIVVPDSSPGSIKAIYRAPISEITVGVGSVSNTTKYPIAIKRAIISPIYNVNDNTNDIALIELDTVLTYNSTVQPIRISSGRVSEGKEVIALGWGFMKDHTMASTLQSVDLQIAPDDNCRKGYPDWGGQNSELVCTGNTPGKDTCYGDSGGPLIWPIPAGQPNAGNYSLLALTSFGVNVLNPTSTECGAEGGVGFYTRVYRYADWITNTTNANATEMYVGASQSLYYRGSTAGLLVGPTAIMAMLLTVTVSGFL